MEISKILLENNVEKNPRDFDGNTPLHLAVLYNLSEDGNLVRLLLASDVDINPKNDKGDTPLHVAALDGNLMNCKILIQRGAEQYPRNNEGKRPLDLVSNWVVTSFLRNLRKRPYA